MTSFTIDHYLPKSYNLVYLRKLIFFVVIAHVLQLTEMLMQKYFLFLYKMLAGVQRGR
jgi:Na+-translocating ferredoxin:NAD+ oxidoreductase RnfA subunit